MKKFHFLFQKIDDFGAKKNLQANYFNYSKINLQVKKYFST